MYCKHCGKQIPDDSEFCNYCGTNLTQPQPRPVNNENNYFPPPNGNQNYNMQNMQNYAPAPNINHNQNSIIEKEKKLNNKLLIVLIVIIALIAIVAALIILSLAGVFKSNGNSQDTTAITTTNPDDSSTQSDICELKYDTTGSSNTIPNIKSKKDDTVLITTVIPLKKDYTFLGWALAKDATDPTYQPGDKFKLSSDTTLFAIWKESAKEFPNGDKYSGSLNSDEEPDGDGTMTYGKGGSYVGSWKNGKYNGKGTYTDPKGNKYVGTWSLGSLQDGEIQYTDGCVYEGQINDSLYPNGMGELKAGKKTFSGNFYNGFLSNGTIYYSDGSTYEGELKDYDRSGKGTFKEKTKYGIKTYSGLWSKDLQNGAGHITYEDNSYFDGNFSNGLKNGYGEAHYTDGTYYEGNWANDYKNGIGTMYYSNGDVKYKGSWKDNKFDGEAWYYDKDKDITYNASFSKGKMGEIHSQVEGYVIPEN